MDSEPGRAGAWLRRPRRQAPYPRLRPSRGPDSLSAPVSLSTWTLSPPNKHFARFTAFYLYVEIHFFEADGPGPCPGRWPGGLVAAIQRPCCCGPQAPAANRDAASSHGGSRPPRSRSAPWRVVNTHTHTHTHMRTHTHAQSFYKAPFPVAMVPIED